MSISPFGVRPASPGGERRRERLVLVIATVGIAATLLAYAISPGVRRDVRHAAHSVSRVLDRDKGGEHKKGGGPATHKPAGGSKESSTPNK
jgi:hypothetical protein